MKISIIFAATGLIGAIFIAPNSVKANPQQGQYIINNLYSQLMEYCYTSRQANAKGLSVYSSTARSFRLNRAMQTGSTYQDAVRFQAGLDWAQNKECPDVW